MLRTLVCLALGAFAAQQVPAATPTLAELAAAPQFRGASLSPDGRHLAMSRLDERGSSLLIVDADSIQPTAEMRFRSHSHVAELAWANDEMLVVSRAERFAGMGHNVPSLTGELYAVSVDGTRRNYLFGGRAGQSKRDKGRDGDRSFAQLIDTLHGDERRILIAEYPWGAHGPEWQPNLQWIDVYSGAREFLGKVPLEFPRITTDQSGQVRFAFGMDEQRRYRTLRFVPDAQRWEPVELGLEEHGSFQPLLFAPDGRSIHATISQAGEPGCLYRVDLDGYGRTRLTCEAQTELAFLMPSRQRGVPLAAVYTATGPRAHVLLRGDPDAALFKELSQQFAPSSVRFLQFSDDGERLLFDIGGDREPGRVYLFDAAKRENRLVYARRPQLRDAEFGQTHPIALTARDGTPLHGFLTLPPGGERQGLPLVVMPHGGPHGVADEWWYDPDTQVLATRGYAVLRVNYRGSAGFGLAFERKGYRQWGQAVQDDIVDATRWAIDKGVAAADRVCIVGGSFGAYSALMSAIREPALYRCAVGLAGVYDLSMMFDHGDIARSEEGRAYLDDVLGRDASALRAQSPAAQVERLQAPVLLVHGRADWRAPLKQVQALAAQLKAHGKAHDLELVGDEGHGLYAAQNREKYFQRLLDFLARHIGTGAG